MVKNHLKSMAVPRAWPTSRKENKYIAKPHAGKDRELSLALVNVVRDLVGACSSARELKTMMNAGNVLVDGKMRKSVNYPVGLFDVVTLKKSKQSYRLVINKVGKLAVVACKEGDAVLGRIAGKVSSKKGTQINLYNGRNIIVGKDDYKVGDSVVLENKDKVSIKEKLPFQKGATAMLTAGKHRGSVGQIKEIQGKIIIFQDGDKEFETKKSFAYVIGTSKPMIAVE